MTRLLNAPSRKVRKQPRRQTNHRKCFLEPLEARQLLAADVLFADSFEQGSNSNDWSGSWVQDSQDDWFRSTQRASDGSRSAEVDGVAIDATLQMAQGLDLTGRTGVQASFDWYIESGFDGNDYLALDFSPDGQTWTEITRLSGNNSSEDVWHHEVIDVAPSFVTEGFQLRYRAKIDGRASQHSDANVDNVRITGVPAGPPEISISDATILEQGSLETLIPSGSGGLDNAQYLTIGPDNLLYVSSFLTDSVLRYDPSTGQSLDVFVASGSGGLDKPQGMAFGADGYFYIASGATNSVLRYSASGAFIGEFVTTGEGGLDSPKGLAWGEDGNLYVASGLGNSILRFDAAGNPLPSSQGTPGTAEFVPAGSGGLDAPRDIEFGPDGRLYVASRGSGDVLRYDGTTGGSPEIFIASGTAGLDDPWGLTFAQDGYLYVGRVQADSVLRFEADTGSFVDIIADSVDGVDEPADLLVTPDGSLLIANRLKDSVARFSSGVVVSLSSPADETVTIQYATVSGTASAADFTPLDGVLIFTPGETTKHILLRAVDDTEVESNESFFVNLSNPNGAGASIADSQAQVTIVDDDASSHISIEDTTVLEGDKTPHYRGPFIDGHSGAHFTPLTLGPDGNVYTAVGTGPGYNTVRRYNGTTGEFIDTFVPHGHIDGVRDMVFRDGYLYVGAEYTDEVLRFHADTGAFDKVFVAAGSGGLEGTHGLTFGPDANGDDVPELYVSGRDSFSVVRYDGVTGQPLGTYVTPGSGGLSWPQGLMFDPAGEYLFVASTGSNQILKYDAQSGAYLGVGASTGLSGPKDVKFGPDGLMYVASGDNDRLIRFTADGTYLDDYVPAGSGGLNNPSRLAFFGPENDLYVTATGNSQILRFGTENEALFSVTLSTPSSHAVTVDYTTGSTGINPATEGADYLHTTGQIVFPAGITHRIIAVPIVDDSLLEPDETFAVTLSLAAGTLAGAVIADGQGVGTILDDGDPASQPPVADDDAYSVVEDSVLNVAAPGVLDGDTDPENDPLTAVLETTTSHGSLTLNPDGSFTYTPNADYHGSDSFTYRANDGTSDSNLATVTIEVTPVNDAPVAGDDSATTDQDTAVTVPVLANDVDVDGDTLTVTNVTDPSNGSVALNADNTITYTPDPGFIGTDTFSYTITDGELTSTATVSIEVTETPSNVIYVYDIRFESKRGNKDWRAVFEIRSDSNGSGGGDEGDAPMAGVAISVNFAGETYSGTTGADGVFRTGWIMNLSSDTHYANVVDLAMADYFWDLLMDLEDDSDGDGNPDDVLVR